MSMFAELVRRENWREYDIDPAIGEALYGAQLVKGAGHKYIRRIPKPGGGYRYIYRVTGGRAGKMAHDDEIQAGSKFKFGEGHYHVESVDGDKVRIVHDETGEKKTVTKEALRNLLHNHHAAAISSDHERALATVHAAGKFGSAKQKARAEEYARRIGALPKGHEVHAEGGKVGTRRKGAKATGRKKPTIREIQDAAMTLGDSAMVRLVGTDDLGSMTSEQHARVVAAAKRAAPGQLTGKELEQRRENARKQKKDPLFEQPDDVVERAAKYEPDPARKKEIVAELNRRGAVTLQNLPDDMSKVSDADLKKLYQKQASQGARKGNEEAFGRVNEEFNRRATAEGEGHKKKLEDKHRPRGIPASWKSEFEDVVTEGGTFWVSPDGKHRIGAHRPGDWKGKFSTWELKDGTWSRLSGASTVRAAMRDLGQTESGKRKFVAPVDEGAAKMAAEMSTSQLKAEIKRARRSGGQPGETRAFKEELARREQVGKAEAGSTGTSPKPTPKRAAPDQLTGKELEQRRENARKRRKGGEGRGAYARKSARAGDYQGANRDEVFRDMLANVSNAKTIGEKDHARDQISYMLAAGTIRPKHGDALYEAAGMTKDGGFKPAAERKGGDEKPLRERLFDHAKKSSEERNLSGNDAQHRRTAEVQEEFLRNVAEVPTPELKNIAEGNSSGGPFREALDAELAKRKGKGAKPVEDMTDVELRRAVRLGAYAGVSGGRKNMTARERNRAFNLADDARAEQKRRKDQAAGEAAGAKGAAEERAADREAVERINREASNRAAEKERAGRAARAKRGLARERASVLRAVERGEFSSEGDRREAHRAVAEKMKAAGNARAAELHTAAAYASGGAYDDLGKLAAGLRPGADFKPKSTRGRAEAVKGALLEDHGDVYDVEVVGDGAGERVIVKVDGKDAATLEVRPGGRVRWGGSHAEADGILSDIGDAMDKIGASGEGFPVAQSYAQKRRKGGDEKPAPKPASARSRAAARYTDAGTARKHVEEVVSGGTEQQAYQMLRRAREIAEKPEGRFGLKGPASSEVLKIYRDAEKRAKAAHDAYEAKVAEHSGKGVTRSEAVQAMEAAAATPRGKHRDASDAHAKAARELLYEKGRTSKRVYDAHDDLRSLHSQLANGWEQWEKMPEGPAKRAYKVALERTGEKAHAVSKKLHEKGKTTRKLPSFAAEHDNAMAEINTSAKAGGGKPSDKGREPEPRGGGPRTVQDDAWDDAADKGHIGKARAAARKKLKAVDDAPANVEHVPAEKSHSHESATRRLAKFTRKTQPNAAGKDVPHGYLNGHYYDAETGHAYASDGHRAVMVPTSHKAEGYHEHVGSGRALAANKAEPSTDVLPQLRGFFQGTYGRGGIKEFESPHTAHAKTLGAFARNAAGTKAGVGGEHNTRDKNYRAEPVALHAKDGSLYASFHGETRRVGDAAHDFEKRYVHPQYLADALQGADGGVKFDAGPDNLSPVHIQREDGERHVIMPLRR